MTFLSDTNSLSKMGGWKLEVGKMILYMSFPVCLFHFFNQPEYFEEYVVTKKREMYPPEDLAQKAQLEDLIRKMNGKKDAELLEAMENIEQKKHYRNFWIWIYLYMKNGIFYVKCSGVKNRLCENYFK